MAGELAEAFVAIRPDVGNFESELEGAVQSAAAAVEAQVGITAETGEIAPAIEAAADEVTAVAEVEGDATGVTSSIDEAIASAAAEVPVDADTSAAQIEIAELSQEVAPVEIPIEVTGAEAAQAEISGVGDAASTAAGGVTDMSGAVGGLGAATDLAQGSTAGLANAVSGLGPKAAGAAGAALALAGFTQQVFTNALAAESATHRFNVVLGDMAAEVEQINVGGLTTTIGDLAVALGSGDEEIRQVAASFFELGSQSGRSSESVALATEQLVAIAARARAVNPQLGEVADIAAGLQGAFARGGRALARYNIDLSVAEINARALADTGKTAATELTVFDKAAAGAALATEKFGDSIQQSIGAAADDPSIRLASLTTKFDEFLESVGTPIVMPLIDILTSVEPLIEDLAQVFGDLVTTALPVLGLVAELAPLLSILLTPVRVLTFAIDTMLKPLIALGEAAQEAIEWLGNLPIVQDIADVFGEIGEALGNAKDRVIEFFKSIPLSGAIQDIFEAIGDAVEFIIEGFRVAGVAQQEFFEFLGDLPGVQQFIDALGTIRDILETIGGFLTDLPGKIGDFVGSLPGVGLVGDAFGLVGDAAGAAGDVISDVGGAVSNFFSDPELTGSVAEGAFEQITASAYDAEAAIASATATAEAEGAKLTEAIVAAGNNVAEAFEQVKVGVNEFVAAATSALPTVSDAFKAVGEDGTLTAGEFVTALEAQSEAIATFRTNLQTVAQASDGAFAELAASIAEQGPAVGGALAAELAAAIEGGNLELVAGVQAATDTFETEWETTTAFFRDVLGPQFVLQALVTGGGAAAAFGQGLTFEERMRIAGQAAQLELDAQGQAIAIIAATEGDAAAQAYGAALALEQKTIDEAVAAGRAIRNNTPVGDASDAGFSVGDAFVEGMRQGLIDSQGRVRSAADALVQQSLIAAERAGIVKSPSHLFRDRIGLQLGLGVAEGLLDSIPTVAQASANAILAAQRAASGGALPGLGLGAGAAAAGAGGGMVVNIMPGAFVVQTDRLDPANAPVIGRGLADGFTQALARRDVQLKARIQ